jgi:hypothetical protein
MVFTFLKWKQINSGLGLNIMALGAFSLETVNFFGDQLFKF